MSGAKDRARSGYVGDCPTCGKRRYLSRAKARKVARDAFPGDHLAAYACGDFWHLGRLPSHVVHRGLTRWMPSRGGGDAS